MPSWDEIAVVFAILRVITDMPKKYREIRRWLKMQRNKNKKSCNSKNKK
jgi:TusA-related sulfurtransferase